MARDWPGLGNRFGHALDELDASRPAADRARLKTAQVPSSPCRPLGNSAVCSTDAATPTPDGGAKDAGSVCDTTDP